MVSQFNELVSIIMPAYNAERFIAESIESVLAQTYPHWELIIIDDASSDNTPGMIQQYPDSRIQYIRVSRIGSPAGVRNHGLRLAKGQFIAFLDADDCYYPETLEKMLLALQDNPEKTAVYGFANNMDEQGHPLPHMDLLVTLESGKKRLPSTYQHTWEKIVTGNISCLLSSLMLHRATFERVGYFNEALAGAEDYEFYVRLFLDRFDGVHCFPEYLYRYRIYPSSLTKTAEYYQRILSSAVLVMDWLFHAASLPPQFQKLKSKAYVNCYRYQARERLIYHQPHLTRLITLEALKNPHIQRQDWIALCFPLLIRSLLPSFVDQAIIALRSHIRQRYQFLKAQVQACCL